MLSESELIELERISDRMRDRYRHLMADDAKRRHRIDIARERVERERMIDKYGGEEIHADE